MTTSQWMAVSCFFDSENRARDSMVELIRRGIPRDLIEVVLPKQMENKFYAGQPRQHLSHALSGAGRGALVGLIVFSFFSLLLILSEGSRGSTRLLFIMLFGPNVGVMGGAFIGLVTGLLRHPKAPVRYLRANEGKGILFLVRTKSTRETQDISALLQSHGGIEIKTENLHVDEEIA